MIHGIDEVVIVPLNWAAHATPFVRFSPWIDTVRAAAAVSTYDVNVRFTITSDGIDSVCGAAKYSHPGVVLVALPFVSFATPGATLEISTEFGAVAEYFVPAKLKLYGVPLGNPCGCT